MIRTYSFSAAGGHLVNEDAFALHPLPGQPRRWLVALADGQGGRAGGQRAAQLACEAVTRHALALSAESLSDSFAWTEILGFADTAVAADHEAGFTTLIGLCVGADGLTGASCGDSAAIVVSPTAAPRTLTAHQFKSPPVGAGDATVVAFETELVAPWRILVMSDGVWKYAGWTRVWDSATQLCGEELIAELQNAARLRTTGEFPDDFTVVLLEGE